MSDPKNYKLLCQSGYAYYRNDYQMDDKIKNALKSIFQSILEGNISGHEAERIQVIIDEPEKFFKKIETIIKDCIFLENQFINTDGVRENPTSGKVRATLNKLKKLTKPFYKRQTAKNRIARCGVIYKLLIRMDKISENYLQTYYSGNYFKDRKKFYEIYTYLYRSKKNDLLPLEEFISKVHSASEIAINHTPKKKGGRSSEKINIASQIVTLLCDAFTDFNLPIKKSRDSLILNLIEFVLNELQIYSIDDDMESIVIRSLLKT